MQSQESEYLELEAAGIIDEASASRAVALECGSIFSVFEEVRFALYAAVAAITAGVGILVKKNLDAAAQAAKIELVAADARNEDEIVRAFSFLERERVQAVMVISDVLFNLHRNRVGELAIKTRLPSMFSIREYVEAGGLMSYGESFREFFRRSASFVDKIIKGAKPGDLPFEQPNRFFFVVNLKAAKSIGLEVPTSLVLRADEVIE